MSLQPGTTLGSYEILAPVGAGGMGEVYRARDAQLGREVAIKVLPEGLAQDPERLQRFEREARSLAALNHPNIATLFGFERAAPADADAPSASAIPFLVMELVAGDTLADRLARGPLPVDEALRIFRQIADGLEAAHENGVIHRDLKPANIKIGDDSGSGSDSTRVKILDFGLAKAMLPEEGSVASGEPLMSQSPTLTLAATQRGEILGTAAYMSPEQARGKAVDKRTDIWAFGVCLFEALTGKRVFEGEDASMTLASLLTKEPNAADLPSAVPPRLRRLLDRCLVKDPRRRLRDIGEARIEIDALLAGDETEPTPESATVAVTSRSRTLVWSLASLAAGALATTAALWLLAPQPEPEAPQTRFVIRAADDPAVESLTEFVLSPDGSRLVYRVITKDQGSRLYVRALDAFDEQATLIPNTEGAQFPFFSPDGEWVAFFLGPGGSRTLRKVRLDSGISMAITSEPHSGYRGTWSVNGDIILGNQYGGLSVVRAATDVPEVLTTVDPEADELAHVHPEVLPGGRAVLFSLLGRSASRIAVLDLGSGERRTLNEHGGEARYVDTGHIVYAYDGRLRAVRFDPDDLEVLGPPIPLLDDVRMGPLAEAYFSLGHNGTLVYSTGGLEDTAGLTLVWVSREGEVVSEVADGDYRQPTISPDGRRIVFEDAERDLEWLEVDSPVPVRLTFDPGYELNPIWGADSKTVYYGAGATQALLDPYSVVADGSVREPQLLIEKDDRLLPTSVSADDRELLLTSSAPAGSSDIVALSLEGEAELRPILHSGFNEYDGALSPDGRLLAYVSDQSGESRVYVTPYPAIDQHVPVSTGFGRGPRWGSDSRELFYFDSNNNRLTLAMIDTTDGLRVADRRPLFQPGPFYLNRDFDVAPDGRLLMVRGPVESRVDSGEIRVVLNWTRQLEQSQAKD